MSSSPDSIPPGWEEEAIPSSPETLPPGFENPNSLTSENQLNLAHLPPPPPPPNAPQESQIHQKETPISLSSSFSPLKEENLDAMQDTEGLLASSQLVQGNLGFSNAPLTQSFTATEMGQMVCGSCNELLSYPRGSKYIQCACCQTINFVLEAHQVGIVKCGKCSVLLMYPYTSKSLRCSSCHYVTEIGPHNIRPPVSVLQGFPAPP